MPEAKPKRTAAQRGRMSKIKGAEGEREAAKVLTEVLGAECHRGRQYHGGTDAPDVKTSIEGLHIEVKRVERLKMYDALQQAKNDAGDEKCPMVVHRSNHHAWVAIVELTNLPKLVKVLQPYMEREPEDHGV